MDIKFSYHEGSQTEKPLEIDTQSSPTKVYIRKNIHEVTHNVDGENMTLWGYDEAVLTYAEYVRYSADLILGLSEAQATLDEIITDMLETI